MTIETRLRRLSHRERILDFVLGRENDPAIAMCNQLTASGLMFKQLVTLCSDKNAIYEIPYKQKILNASFSAIFPSGIKYDFQYSSLICKILINTNVSTFKIKLYQFSKVYLLIYYFIVTFVRKKIVKISINLEEKK